MFARTITTCFTIAVLALCAVAQDSTVPEGMPPMGAPAEMKALESLAGSYEVTVKNRMAPDAPWETSTAMAVMSNEMDGCLQRMTFNGTVMNMPFHGESATTFNRETKRYESTWIDNLSAHISMSAGGYQGEKLVMEGDDMMMGVPYKMRSTMIPKGKDEIQWNMETSMDGGKTWFTNMEMLYRRKG